MRPLFLILFLVSVFTSCTQKNTAIKPTVSALTQAVYVSVTVQPDSLYEAFASVNGILEANLVTEGAIVKKGTQLCHIANQNTQFNSENARLSYTLAQKNYSGNTAILLSIENEMKAAQLQLYNDSINFYRQKNLWDQHIGSKAQFDAKQLAYQLSGNTLENLKTKYKRTKNELQTQLNQASNTYKNAVVSNQDYTIESKMDGKVYALYKNPGELVNAQQPIAMIGSKDTFILELLVDEVDIVKVTLQQQVVVSLDAYPDETFLAQVTKIYPTKDERNQTFKVEATFVDAPNTLYPGLSGEGNIIIATKENVLTLPTEYLSENNKVTTEEGDIEVVTGLKTDDYIEIISGINAETIVLKPQNQ